MGPSLIAMLFFVLGGIAGHYIDRNRETDFQMWTAILSVLGAILGFFVIPTLILG